MVFLLWALANIFKWRICSELTKLNLLRMYVIKIWRTHGINDPTFFIVLPFEQKQQTDESYAAHILRCKAVTNGGRYSVCM